MQKFVTIYVTCASESEAETIAKAVLEARLAACANILPGVRSLYHWQGQVAEDTEIALLLKARAADFEAVSGVIKQHHSYEVPCIVAWPLEVVDASYAQWLEAETNRGNG